MNGRMLVLVLVLGGLISLDADEPVEVRAENLVVNPSTGPVCYVSVRNLLDKKWEGTVTVGFPDGWKVESPRKKISIEAGKTRRVPYSIEKAVEVTANRYPFEITAEGCGGKVTRKQDVVWASAPYYNKTEIDGDPKEWKDSIPITFETKGKKTVVRTYWSRRYFYILVEADEDKLGPGDAVQFSLAERDSKSERWEYLVRGMGGDSGKCLLLVSPGEEPKRPEEAARSAVAIKREKCRTIYEIKVSLTAMRALRPTPGREFCFSLLVHDPDGTGLRDMGSVMGLPDSRRSRKAWCDWKGAKWPEKPPFDGKIEWGFCSSIH